MRRGLLSNDDFTVLVNLAAERTELSFHIIPTPVLNDWLVVDFNEWVATPGKNGRPHSSTTPKRNLSLRHFRPRLEQYEENWELLWE